MCKKIASFRMFPETVYCPLDEGCGISQTPPPLPLVDQRVDVLNEERINTMTQHAHTPSVLTTCSTDQSVLRHA